MSFARAISAILALSFAVLCPTNAHACQIDGTIQCNTWYSATMSSAVNHSEDYSCFGWSMDGVENSWEVTPPAGSRAFVVAYETFPDLDVDFDIAVEETCSSGTCVADGTTFGGDSERTGWWIADGAPYTVTIDEYWAYYYGIDYDFYVACSGTCDPATDVAQEVTCSTDVPGTTVGESNRLSGYVCGSPYTHLLQNNPEVVYEFVPTATGPVTFELSGMSADQDLYVLEDSCDPMSCIAASTLEDVLDDSVTFDAVAGRTYYLVVEGYAGTASFDLSFESGGGVCVEDCDDGIDNELPVGDGLIDCEDTADCALDPVCYCDQDGDGHDKRSADSAGICGGNDCDDGDADRFPGNPEVCDGLDNDCNGSVDDGLMSTWYADADADGYGNPGDTVTACSQPTGYVATAGDCNDGVFAINPGAAEACNGIDDDCVGGIDNGITYRNWYDDSDSDGWGDTLTGNDCQAPNTGDVDQAGDCNDGNPAIHPGATEVCNGVDDDCVSGPDNGLSFANYWLDGDSDGWGTGSADNRCSTPSYPHATQGGDCNDANPAIHPGQAESCNGIDDNCVGGIDEGLVFTDYFADADADAYGTGAANSACASPGTGWATASGDCDDSNASINPGRSEVCNGIDDDCVGGPDNGLVFTDWFADNDGDAYGSGAATNDCKAPGGSWSAAAGDCNDGNGAIHPGATEVCNGVDDNCAGGIDEGIATSAWYRDVDNDTFGDVSQRQDRCSAPNGFVGDSADCDDTNPAINPDAQEICNAVDDDCDGLIDTNDPTLDPTALGTWYLDADTDGFGDPTVSQDSCTPVAGHVLAGTDCNDSEVLINPAADEVCDDVDNDCDGLVDSADPGVDASTGTTYYADADGDGYGTAGSTVESCDAPGGFVSDATDCDDGSDSRNPGLSEVCDGIDNDCDFVLDEQTECYDDDGDGTTEDGGDCDDANAAVHPNAPEVYDTFDQDCDGVVDEGTEGFDDDGDGFAEVDGDCNDSNRDVTPSSTEVDGNGIDDDCDGSVDSGAYDPDGDGYSQAGGDCGEGDDTVHPGAAELPDGIDNDCDGDIDEGTYAADDDGDGFCEGWDVDGDGVADCSDGATVGDCNDYDPGISPSATETINGVDDDCDGAIDDTGDTHDDDGDGVSEAQGDCDDADPEVYPGAPEVANDVDDDCDGLINEGFSDLDGDGYTSDDCDDGHPWVNPGLPEMCGDGLDNNCDSNIDENCGMGVDLDTGGTPTVGGAGCGCQSGGSPAGWLPLLLVLLVACRGNDIGVSTVDKRLTVSPMVSDLGDVPVGDTRSAILQFDSLAGGDIQVRNLELLNVDGDFFSLPDPEPFVVPAGDQWLVQLDYSPTEGGLHRGLLRIVNESETPQIEVNIRAHAAAPRLQVYPAMLDFGPVAVGESAQLELTLANQGDIDIELAAVTVDAPFSVPTAALPVSFEPGDTHVLSVLVDPDTSDEVIGQLQLDLGPFVDAPDVDLLVNACQSGLPALYDADSDGYTACAGDCDDHDPKAHPGAEEFIDDVDQDCDGVADNGTTAYDDDGDGFTELAGDCNDTDAAVGPGASEDLTNGVDDDCDGVVDLGTTDADADGVSPGGGDCNDGDAGIRPGRPELPDGIDQDCDGTIDEGTTAYDDDGDGYCEDPIACASTAHQPGDCADVGPGAAAVWPGAPEVADGIDNDCDGVIDNGTERDDSDGDGFSELGGDCDDADPSVGPSRTEVIGNGVDDDCDGTAE